MKVLAILLLASAALMAADPPTFYRDVLPILQERCQGCHRAGEVGPMPLVTYDDARPWAKAIKQAVLTRKMPPWNVSGAAGKYRNDPSLSEQQVDRVVAWVEGGAVAGDPQDAPAPRKFAEGWTIGQPDLVFEMPEPFPVPTSGTLEYMYVIVPTGFREDKWMSAAEVRPGNRAVMHHANVYIREPGSTWLREYPIGKVFVPSEKGERVGTGGNSSAGATVREQVIAGYIPGRPAKQEGPGYGLLIPAGSDLVFQLHYTANGKATTDRTRIGFVLAKTPPRKRVIRIQASNATFAIPPGDANYPVSGSVKLGMDCELIAAYPHMHYRGKSMALTAEYPTGEKDELVRVPKYDFNWQLVYELTQPRILPKGTILHADAHFDNSPNNRLNPDPIKEVRWGDQSWEEMMVGFFDVAIPLNADPRNVVAEQTNR